MQAGCCTSVCVHCVLVEKHAAVAGGGFLGWVLFTGMGTMGIQTATRSRRDFHSCGGLKK